MSTDCKPSSSVQSTIFGVQEYIGFGVFVPNVRHIPWLAFKQRQSVSKFRKALAHVGTGTGMKGESTSATFASAMRGRFEGPGPP